MKVDFHSHILPGLDDGARTLDDALMLAGAMRSWGFERVYCTPHINALYRNTPEIIRPAFEELKEALEENYDLCDVELQVGGQPLYYYLIAVE